MKICVMVNVHAVYKRKKTISSANTKERPEKYNQAHSQTSRYGVHKQSSTGRKD